MKYFIFVALLISGTALYAQQIQLHYDFRHSIDPELNRTNFPSVSFEYFKGVEKGAFLFKMQTDFNGSKNNPGQLFLQVSKSMKFWKPKIYLSAGYSGGLGVAPPSFGYYLTNSFNTGVSYPFQWKGAWMSANLTYRYSAFPKPSHDPQCTIYFGRGFLNYRIFLAGSFVGWTENRNQGTDYTKGLSGKKFAFFGDPQVWIKVKGQLSAGTRISVFYHLLTDKNTIQVYPTLAVKNQF